MKQSPFEMAHKELLKALSLSEEHMQHFVLVQLQSDKCGLWKYLVMHCLKKKIAWVYRCVCVPLHWGSSHTVEVLNFLDWPSVKHWK